MTQAQLNAQIDSVIKDNTSGTDFITAAELNAVLKAIVGNMVIPDSLPVYDDLQSATAAVGAGKVVKASGNSLSVPQGVLLST